MDTFRIENESSPCSREVESDRKNPSDVTNTDQYTACSIKLQEFPKPFTIMEQLQIYILKRVRHSFVDKSGPCLT
jgi:hypothetical protein